MTYWRVDHEDQWHESLTRPRRMEVKATIMEGGFSRFDVVERVIEVIPQDGTATPSIEQRLEAATASLMESSSTTAQLWYCLPHRQCFHALGPDAVHRQGQIAQTLSFEVEGLVPFDPDEMVVEHVSEVPMTAAPYWPSYLALAWRVHQRTG